MRKSITIVIGILLFLTACAGPRPTTQQLTNADYGPYPEKWKQTTSDLLTSEKMVRPKDLRIWTIEPPIKTWVATPEREIIYGWGVCGTLATGVDRLEPFFVLIQRDEPVFEALGYHNIKRIPGKTWTSEKGSYNRYCPGLFK